jgi:hypothetical protein
MMMPPPLRTQSQAICRAVEHALALPAAQRAARGAAAKRAFHAERKELMANMERVRGLVARLLAQRHIQQQQAEAAAAAAAGADGGLAAAIAEHVSKQQ